MKHNSHVIAMRYAMLHHFNITVEEVSDKDYYPLPAAFPPNVIHALDALILNAEHHSWCALQGACNHGSLI